MNFQWKAKKSNAPTAAKGDILRYTSAYLSLSASAAEKLGLKSGDAVQVASYEAEQGVGIAIRKAGDDTPPRSAFKVREEKGTYKVSAKSLLVGEGSLQEDGAKMGLYHGTWLEDAGVITFIHDEASSASKEAKTEKADSQTEESANKSASKGGRKTAKEEVASPVAS